MDCEEEKAVRMLCKWFGTSALLVDFPDCVKDGVEIYDFPSSLMVSFHVFPGLGVRASGIISPPFQRL